MNIQKSTMIREGVADFVRVCFCVLLNRQFAVIGLARIYFNCNQFYSDVVTLDSVVAAWILIMGTSLVLTQRCPQCHYRRCCMTKRNGIGFCASQRACFAGCYAMCMPVAV